MFFFLFNKKDYFYYKKYFLFLLTPLWDFTDQLANQKVVNNDPYEFFINILSIFYYKKVKLFLPINDSYKDILNR